MSVIGKCSRSTYKNVNVFSLTLHLLHEITVQIVRVRCDMVVDECMCGRSCWKVVTAQHITTSATSTLKNRSKHKSSFKISHTHHMLNHFLSIHVDRQRPCILPHVHPLAITHLFSLSKSPAKKKKTYTLMTKYKDSSVTWLNYQRPYRHFLNAFNRKNWTATHTM